MFKQFDIVRLKTTKRVFWLSGSGDVPINPHGNWSVVAIMGINLVLAKDKTIIKIPFQDVEKIADYNINTLFKEKDNGQEKG